MKGPCVAAMVGMLLAGPAMLAARGECVDAAAYVTREGGSPTYLTGEHDRCLAPTPWNQSFTYNESFTRSGLPAGTPNGYGVYLAVPAP